MSQTKLSRSTSLWDSQTATLLGITMLVIALSVMFSSLELRVDRIIDWIACLGLFVLTGLFTTRLDNGMWTGYPYLAMMLAWLILGLNAALALVIIGSGLILVLMMALGKRFGLSQITTSQALSMALGRIAISSLALLSAAALGRMLGFIEPLEHLTLNNVPAISFALIGGLFTAHVMGVLLLGGRPEVLALLVETLKSHRLVNDLMIVVGVVVLAAVATYVEPLIFTLLLIVVAFQAIRYRRAEQAEQSLMGRVQELSVLNRISETLSANLLMDDLVLSIYDYVASLTLVDTFYIALSNPEHETLEYPLVMVHHERVYWPIQRQGKSAADYVIRTRLMLTLNGNLPERLEIVPDVTEQRYPYMLGLPLLSGSEILGVMMLMNAQSFELDTTTFNLLQTVAQQAGIAIHNARLYAQSTRLVHQLSLINTSVQQMILNLDRNEATDKICQAAMTIGQAQAVALYQIDREHKHAMLIHSIGFNDVQQQLYRTLPVIGFPYRPELQQVVDTHIYHKQPELVERALRGGFRAMTEIPLRSTTAMTGFISLYYYGTHYSSSAELDLLGTLASQVASVMDNAELFSALELYAFEMAQLAHLSRISTSHLDLNKVAKDVSDILSQVMMVSHAMIAVLSDDKSTVRVLSTDANQINQQLDLPEMWHLLRHPNTAPLNLHLDDAGISPALAEMLTQQGDQSIAIVPMQVNQDVIGVVLLGTAERRTLSDREWQMVEMAANQIAIHIQNARQYAITYEALRQRLDQLTMIEDIARQISSTLDFDRIIENMLEAAVRSTQADYTALALMNEQGGFTTLFELSEGADFKRYPLNTGRDIGLIGYVARTGETVITPDNRISEYYMPTPNGMRYLSSLAVPLIRDNVVLGVLNVESTRLDFFREEHASFLSNVAGHAVISIGNAQMLEERQYQVQVLASLQALALQLSSAVDVRSVAGAVLKTALELFSGTEGALFHYDEGTKNFHLLVGLRSDMEVINQAQSLIPSQIAREAAQTGEIQIVKSTQEVVQREEGATLTTSISVPLRRGSRVREVLTIAFDHHRTFSKRDLEALNLLAGQAAGHLENATLYEQIRAGNERMSAILRSTRDGVILLDHKGMLVEANPAARHMLGDALERYTNEVMVDTLLSRRDANSGYRSSETTEESVFRRQFQQQTPQGVMYFEEIGAPVLDAQRRTIGWLLVLRDVTEEKLLNQFREEITSMVVHDLRGPLASIISGIHLAVTELLYPDGQEMAARTLRLSADSANKLMVLVESLLDISKMEAREMTLRREPFSLDAVVEQSVKALAATIQENQIDLQIDIPADLALIDGDSDFIRRVIVNLLDNAIRYTPTQQSVLISARLNEQGDQVTVRMADSGPGIPPEERDRVFEKFKQVKSTQGKARRRGTGLGLTFCKLAVEAHGGQIWVEEKGPLSGASFAFTLPVASEVFQVH